MIVKDTTTNAAKASTFSQMCPSQSVVFVRPPSTTNSSTANEDRFLSSVRLIFPALSVAFTCQGDCLGNIRNFFVCLEFIVTMKLKHI